MEAAQPLRVGGTINAYQLGEKLGAGGMGVVYKAFDTRLRRTVALKFLPQDPDSSDVLRARLIEEARAASVLDHPNIGTIYGVEEAPNGQMFIVMAYYEGRTIADMIHGPMAATDAVGIGQQITAGLAEAHAHNVIHRDIKPSNVILTSHRLVKIVDFGLARMISSASATRSLNTAGTAAYMSPEQALEGQAIDQRTDLWSLGVMLYQMLTGELPFSGNSVPAMLLAIVQSPPREMGKEIAPELQGIVYRALAKDPAERYQNALEMMADLERIAPTAALSTRPTATNVDISRYRELASHPTLLTATRARRRTRSIWIFASLSAAVVLALLLLIPAVRQKIQPTGVASGLPDRKVLAVLPFQVQAADPTLVALGNGLAETLAAKLARLGSDHSLQVVPSTELRARNLSKIDEVRREFGVTLALQISLQRTDGLIHFAYSLVNAISGQVLSSNSLDASSTDPFAIEDKVAIGAAAALGIHLNPEERRDLGSHGTTRPEAYSYYLQGRGYLEKGPEEVDGAILMFTRALDVDPAYGSAEAQLGDAYWVKYAANKDKSFIPKARQACSRAVNLGNAGAEGHLCLGVLENGTGQYEKAVDEFTRATQLDPTLDEAYVGLGSAFERLGKLKDAEGAYQQIITLRPQYWKGYNVLGIFYCRQSQYDQCAAMFQKVVELTPESFRGYANLGAADLAQGRYEQAIVALEQSLRIRATPATYENLGTAYFHLRRFAEAASTYSAAVHLNSNDHVMWGNLAEAQYYAGDRKEASVSWRKAISQGKDALAVNPRDPEVLSELAAYNAMLGERATALKYLNLALAYGKSDKEILFQAALIYNRLGETGPALEWLRKALHAGYSLTTVRESPDLDNLRQDARFQALLASKPD